MATPNHGLRPPAGLTPYVSQLDPGCTLGVGAGAQAQWPSPTSRGHSFETALGSAAPSLYGSMPPPRPGAMPAGYQKQQAPTLLRPSAPMSQGNFPFHTGPFNFTARPTAAPLESVQEGATAAYASMPATQTPVAAGRGAPMLPVSEATRAMSMPDGAHVVDRASLRTSFSKHAFLFVDAQRIGKINMSQNKTGLTLVFEQLGDVKLPKDEWYVQVFRNYDKTNIGLIGFDAFMDIVVQWDEHQQEKKRKQREREQAAVAGGTSAATYEKGGSKPLPQPPPPPEGGAAVAATPKSTAPPRERPSVKLPPDASPAGGAPSPQLGSEIKRSSKSAPGLARGDSPDHGGDSKPTRSRVSEVDVLPHGPSRSSVTTRVGAAELSTDVMFPTYVGRLAIFDDYEFHGDAGKGAFGKVMVVRQKTSKQLRACKVMAGQTAMQRELIDTEINLLKAMNHPNIVKLYEVYFEEGPQKKVNNGNIYLIFELCEGGDLFGRILHHYERLHQPMTEGHVAYMMSQILSAVAYLHERGIVHRDIKPENILFVDRSSSSAIKIIDYGLADFTEKIRSSAREVKVEKTGWTGQIARMLPTVGGRHLIPYHERKKVMVRAGTPHYMAPEMIEQQWYDQKADLFSVGIILCQLLTGWHPFHIQQVDDEASVRRKIADPTPVEFPADIFSNVSREAQDLCRQLLEKDPKKRLSSKQALEHAWFRDPHKPSPYGDKGGLSMSIFDGLMKYQAYNKLKRAVLQLLTRELSEYQIQELRKKFNALDSKGDGLLSFEELMEGMRHIGYEMTDEELSKIMIALDGSGNQQIGYKEFISALIERRVKFDRQQLLATFKKFDKNDTGKIAYEDVAALLKTGASDSPGISPSEWVEIAGPGSRSAVPQRVELTFEEFCALMEAEE